MMILGFVVPTTEVSTKLPVGEEVVAWATGVVGTDTPGSATQSFGLRPALGFSYEVPDRLGDLVPDLSDVVDLSGGVVRTPSLKRLP